MKYVKFYTLGCKVNSYETEAMRGLFEEKGYTVTEEDTADVIVVNTCTVTQMSDKKSRQIIRRAKRNNPNSIIAVVGCYAQVSPDEVSKIDGVDIILGTTDRKNVAWLVEEFSGEKINAVNNKIHKEFEEMFTTQQSHVRATIKIQDGCQNFCSYCIIPFARGPIRSRSVGSTVKEVERLAKEGYSEVVLVGIHLASYGKDLGLSLIDVLKAVCSVKGIKRVRIGSVEPNLLTSDFCNEIAMLKNLMPHFHVSMQSGCTETLKRMNRKYTAEEYLQALERLRSTIHDCSITTDVMVGFPSESEEEFNESLDTVKKANFSDIHVFPYSKRKGTKAAVMDGQVEESVKHNRANTMIELGRKLRHNYYEKFIGTEMEVLFEQEVSENIYEGLTENYIRVVAKGKGLEKKYQKVKLIKICDDYCEGEISADD